VSKNQIKCNNNNKGQLTVKQTLKQKGTTTTTSSNNMEVSSVAIVAAAQVSKLFFIDVFFLWVVCLE